MLKNGISTGCHRPLHWKSFNHHLQEITKKTQTMKTPYPNLSLFLHFFALLAGVSLYVQAVFAADEICISCGPQVSVSGSFTHHKDRPSVAIEGTSTDPAVFREDVNGTNFTVTISQLPAGKYTITVGAADTVAGGTGERVFDVTVGDNVLAKDFDIFATADRCAEGGHDQRDG